MLAGRVARYSTIEPKKRYKKGIRVLKENRLGNIKKELKIKELVKGNKQAGLLENTTTSI